VLINHIFETTSYSRIFFQVEGIILDRVDSITDFGLAADSRMSFSKYTDVTVGKAGVHERIVG
jgi:hypothetical protein